MKRRMLLAVAAACLGLTAMASRAPAAPEVEYTLEDLQVVAYGELSVEAADNGLLGVQEMTASTDLVFLAVQARLNVQWIAEVRQLSIPSTAIMLADDAGRKHLPIGQFQHGQFRPYESAVYAYRPRKWPEDKDSRPAIYGGVYAVPKAAPPLTLKVGKASARITVPSETVPPENTALNVTVQIRGARLVNEVKSYVSRGGVKVPTVVSNPNGKLLEVKLVVTPREDLAAKKDSFGWQAKWIGLICHTGHFVPAAGGYSSSGHLRRDAGYTISKDRAGKWRADEAVLYFAVPDGTTRFRLTWLLMPVGEGTVGP